MAWAMPLIKPLPKQICSTNCCGWSAGLLVGGTGKSILRAVAAKFESIAKDFDEKACSLRHKADGAEFTNQLIVAKHFRQRAFIAAAEAKALRRVGWTKWRQPMAPKADGTRKVVWQTHSRATFFKIFGLNFLGYPSSHASELGECQRSMHKARTCCYSKDWYAHERDESMAKLGPGNA